MSKKKEIREKSIKLRVSNLEHAQMLERVPHASNLSRWLRLLALGQSPEATNQRAKKKVPIADPALIREVAKIGNNLNQISRAINTAGVDVIGKVELSAQLLALEQKLDLLIKTQALKKTN